MKKKKKLKRISAFDIINTTFLLLLAVIIIVPFYYTVIVSLMPKTMYIRNPGTLFPGKISFENYIVVLKHSGMIRSFLNSVAVVILGVAYNMTLTVTMAYGFSKKNFPGRSMLFNVVIFTMFFSGGLVPYFLVVKALGLVNHFAVLIIPGGLSVYNMIIMKNFFQQIPPSLEESAKIDGAGSLRTLVQILLPMVVPCIATLSLFVAVGLWNDWFTAMLFISKRDLYPVQTALREILWTGEGIKNMPTGILKEFFSEGVRAASVIFVMVPIMLVYPFLQKYFAKGVMIGAIKA